MAAMTVEQFWQRLRESELFSDAVLSTLTSQCESSSSEVGDGVTGIAEWLVRQRQLTVYQARALLAGRTQFRFASDFQIQEPRGAAQDWGRRWDAIHRPSGHPLILHLAGTPGAAQRLRDHRPWTVAAQLDAYYGTVEQATQTAGLSELPLGVTVRSLLRKQKSFAFDEVCEIGVQTCLALIEMHARGEIHGHLAPDEIVIDANRHVTLLRHPGWMPRKNEGSGLKTLTVEQAVYSAPELAATDSIHDVLTDVYALGCVFYELLTGRLPFAGNSVEEIMRKHAQEPIVPVHEGVDVPPQVHQMVSFMMAKRRSIRHTSLIDVREQLIKFLPPGWQPPKKVLRDTEGTFRGRMTRDIGDSRATVERSQSLRERVPRSTEVHSASASPETAETGVRLQGLEKSIRTSGSVNLIAKRRSQRPTSRWTWILAGVVGSVLLIGVVILLWGGDDSAGTSPRSSSNGSPAGDPSAVTQTSIPEKPADNVAETDLASHSVELIEDDGSTPWESPTSGRPLSLEHVPAGAQFFLFVRPATLLSTQEGQRLWQVLEMETRLADWFAGVPVSWQSVESLLVAWVPREEGLPGILVQCRLQPDQVTTLRQSWTEPATDSHGEFGDLGAWHVRLLASEPQLAILGARDLVEEAMSTEETVLSRPLARLASKTDSDRAVTVFGSPRFLDDPARWTPRWSALRDPLLLFLGEKADAVAWSLALDDREAYLEWRVLYAADESLAARERWMPRQMSELASRVERLLGQTPIDPHWQPLALRLPRMLQLVAEQTRSASDDGSLLTNAVLPPEAIHNLTLAGERLISQLAMGDGPNENARGENPASQPAIRWEDLLSRPMTLTIPQQSLDAVVQELAGLVRDDAKNSAFQIEVRGEDLQKDGITRNQQIRNLRLQDKPLREILTELVRRANPVAVSSVQQPEQKLVWVPAPDQGDEGRRVWITTRTTALQKGLQLPKEFMEVGEPPTLK